MQSVIRNIGASVVPSLFALAYAITYGALIYAGPLQSHMAFGVAEALIGGAIGCFVLASTSQFKPLVAGPEGTTVALLATMTAGLAPELAALPADDAAWFAMAALAATTLASGLCQVTLGCLRLGRLVRYIPYPVVAGFLGSTAWLLVTGASRLVVGSGIGPNLPAALMRPFALLELTLTVAWALGLWLIGRYARHPVTIPVALILMVLLMRLILPMAGITQEAARHAGLLFASSEGHRLGLPWFQADFGHLPWHSLVGVAGDIAATAVMSILAILLNSTGIEVATRTESDLDHELRVHGLANIITAPFCGLVTNISITRTLACRMTGGEGRLPGLVTGAVLLVVAVSGLDVASYLPRFVLGGLLLLMGVQNFWQWAIRSFVRLPLRDWLTVVAIIVLTATVGTLWGLLYGVLACCVILALDVGRIDVLRHAFGVHERPSSRQRSAEEMQILVRDGNKVQVLVLAGFIFFGSTHRLYEQVKQIVAAHGPQVLIFDFTDVVGADSSATASFTKIADCLREAGIEAVAIGVKPMIRPFLQDNRSSPSTQGIALGQQETLDELLEHWENRLLDRSELARQIPNPLIDWMTTALGDAGRAHILASHLTRRDVSAGVYLCHQNDPTDTLLFIESGRVSVLLKEEGKRPLRLRVFGARTILGEVGFFLNRPRTASLRCEEPTVLWALGRPEFLALRQSEPEMVTALFTYVVQVQSERLAYATRQIAALNRS